MQSTRQQILQILKEERQATVEDLAEQLELTPMTIRHHLNVLQAQNLVEASKVRRSKKVGRPRLLYTLTEEADELFPSNYGALARHLVNEIKEAMGKGELRAMFQRIADRIARGAPPPHAGQSFEERLTQVAEFLEEHGFISDWEKTAEGYVFTNINCPYRQVTREHGEVCEMDIALITRLMGVAPKRLATLQAGDAACRYLLVPPE
ncbi:MAG: ArsR family transcriptional regulator [Anaerolineae bacterium]|jgi:predicted ArsR family transcriptional regulator